MGALARRRAVALPLVSADAVVCAGVGLVLAGVAFGASGGTQLARTTYTEIAVMLGGALLAAAALVVPRPGARLRGAWTLAALAVLAAWTALSVSWSLAPSDSWVEANRILAYVAAFAGALGLARLAPRRWAGMVGGVALACVLVVGWALLTKVFPGTLAADDTFARLRAPFGYWNAVGLMAALGVPPLLWLAVKRSGNLALNALAYPGLGLSFVVLLLSYSRGALLAVAVGLAFWFAVVPLRLRGVTALVVSAAAAAPVVAWAFAREGLTSDDVPLVARTEAGHELGVLLAAMTVVLLVAGLAIGFTAANRPPTLRVRRRAGIALVAVVALVPVAGLVVLGTKPGGLDGQIAKGFDQLTDPDASTPSNQPGRLTATASVRSRYWREAIDIWQTEKLRGAGAGSFPVARTRFRTGPLEVRQAHGYAVETLAGLGLVGLVLSLGVLAVWLVGARRVTGLRRADRGLPVDAERVGVLTLTAVVVVFGVHSLIDWTWLVPGTAIVGLACAAWVVGREPLRERLARQDAGEPAPVLAGGGALPPRRRLRPLPGLAAATVLAVAVAAAWTAFQPLRAEHAGDEAFRRLALGQRTAALDIAGIAVRRNPLSVDPLFDRSAIESALGLRTAAERTLEQAVELQPANAEAWRRLGEYRALVQQRPRAALAPLQAAYYLDPRSPDTEASFLLLRRQLALQ